MSDAGQTTKIEIETAPAGTIKVQCPFCGNMVGQTAPVPRLFSTYHCTKCHKWSSIFIPSLAVLRRVVEEADRLAESS